MELKDFITLIIAVIGAVLGVFNAWRNWSNDRLRVRVSTGIAAHIDGSRSLTVDVVNLSAFPVTVTHVGFTLLGTDRHVQITRPIVSSGATLPIRLEPRTSFTVIEPFSAMKQDLWASVDSAYISTACGHRITGPGGLFIRIKRFALADE